MLCFVDAHSVRAKDVSYPKYYLSLFSPEILKSFKNFRYVNNTSNASNAT